MATVKVLSSNGTRALLEALGPEFERQSGHRLAITFDPALVQKRRIEAGEAFDLAILTQAVMDEMIKQGRIAAATAKLIARSGVGLAVRAGARQPDIRSIDALKSALLVAKSIAYTTEGASGIHFQKVIERLGIADAIKTKAKPQPGGLTAALAARGEVELAVQLMSELAAVPGIDVVGPFPEAVQHHAVLVAGISAHAEQAGAAKALIAFLTAPEAVTVMRAKGMQPG